MGAGEHSAWVSMHGGGLLIHGSFGGFFTYGGGNVWLGEAETMDRKIGAVHAAEVAAGALIRLNEMGNMVSLGIEC